MPDAWRVRMVCLTVAFTAPSSRAARQLLDGLRFIEPTTRLQRGCLGCSSWTGPGLTLHHVEHWESEADMRRRLGAQEFTALLEMVEAAREPRVQFDFVAVTRGLDYVAEVRGAFGA
jgi:quinol monooxygenase YgiN